MESYKIVSSKQVGGPKLGKLFFDWFQPSAMATENFKVLQE